MAIIKYFILIILILLHVNDRRLYAIEQKENSMNLLSPNEVLIAATAVEMPLERILLIRKNSEYCAIKFTKFWTGSTDEDYFAKYESYYQGDTTGDFLNNNVQHRMDELSYPKPRGIGRFSFSFGNKEVQCGSIRLLWTRKGIVCFFGKGQRPGDYGIELAPTQWTDISQVKVFDKRIKWLKYDESRARKSIPTDKLW